MKKIILSLLAATIFIFSACQSDIPSVEANKPELGLVQETEILELLEQKPTSTPEPTITQEPSSTLSTVDTAEPTDYAYTADNSRNRHKIQQRYQRFLRQQSLQLSQLPEPITTETNNSSQRFNRQKNRRLR